MTINLPAPPTVLALEAACVAARSADEACPRTGARYDMRAQKTHNHIKFHNFRAQPRAATR